MASNSRTPARAGSAAEDAVQTSRDRACVYRTLSELFARPDEAALARTREHNLREQVQALDRIAADSGLVSVARELCDLFEDIDLGRLRRGHRAAFDESSENRCSATEMEQHGDTPQAERVDTFGIADVASFYKTFGVEVDAGGERVDHISTELEFMKLLAVKEAIALQGENSREHAQTCRDASRVFLRDHLVRWAPRLGRCLAASGADPVYSAAGRLLSGFIEFDAALVDAAGAPTPREGAAKTKRS